MVNKYSRLFATTHWLHAVMLLAILVGSTLALPHLPDAADKLSVYKGHMLFGFAIILVMLVRLLLLWREPQIEPLPMTSLRQKLVQWNHRLIYGMILLTALSGMATTKSASIGQVILRGKDPSVYTGPHGTTAILAAIHDYSAWALAALIAMHVAGVLVYMIQKRRNILTRVGITG